MKNHSKDWLQAIYQPAKFQNSAHTAVQHSSRGVIVNRSRVRDLVLRGVAAVTETVERNTPVGSDCEPRDTAMGQRHANPGLRWQL